MAIPGIQEIQALATKYSKPQLQKMAQMGLIDPTKAVMAGMMIDRIQQQNTQPPQQTVAEEVMGAPQPPQQMPQQAAGVAGLPSNLPPQMAGGGIVAFADGGDIDDYADGGVVRFDKGGATRYDKLSTPYDELINKAAREYGIDPVVYKRLLGTESNFKTDVPSYRGPEYGYGIAQIADIHGLTREQRADPTVAIPAGARIFKGFLDKAGGDYEKALQMYKGAVSPGGKSRMKGVIESILEGVTGTSEARAAEPSSLPPIASAPNKSTRPKSSTERLMEQQVMEDYGLGPQKITPELKKASEESAARALERQAKQKELRQLEGGFFEQKPLTDEQAARAAQLRQEIESFNKLPPIAPPKKETKPEAAPAPAPAPKAAEKEVPKVEKAEMGPARPSAEQRLENQLAGLSGKAGKELTPDEVLDEQDKMFARLGVNKDFFTNLRKDYESTRGKFQDRADKAAGHALMMFGAGLMGARQGEFFSTASKAAQQSLMMYMSSMDKISEQEEKLNKDLRDLSASEEQYKRSRATSALEAVQKNREKVADRQVQIADLEIRGLGALTNAAVEEFKARNPAEYVKYKRIAEETGKPIEEVIKMFNMQKSGEISRTTAFKEYNDLIANPMSKAEIDKRYPGGFEDYFRALQGGAGGGGSSLIVGQVVDGYKYKGGDPNSQGSWEKVK